jgi:hypothetical protein
MFCASGNQSHLEEVEDADSVRLQHGPVRLGELRRMFPEASKKMLTQHLRRRKRDSLVIGKDSVVDCCMSGIFCLIHWVSLCCT